MSIRRVLVLLYVKALQYEKLHDYVTVGWLFQEILMPAPTAVSIPEEAARKLRKLSTTSCPGEERLVLSSASSRGLQDAMRAVSSSCVKSEERMRKFSLSAADPAGVVLPLLSSSVKSVRKSSSNCSSRAEIRQR
jgi:hypothetical protein